MDLSSIESQIDRIRRAFFEDTEWLYDLFLKTSVRVYDERVKLYKYENRT